MKKLTNAGAMRRLLKAHDAYAFLGEQPPEYRPEITKKFKAARDEVLSRMMSPPEKG